MSYKACLSSQASEGDLACYILDGGDNSLLVCRLSSLGAGMVQQHMQCCMPRLGKGLTIPMNGQQGSQQLQLI